MRAEAGERSVLSCGCFGLQTLEHHRSDARCAAVDAPERVARVAPDVRELFRSEHGVHRVSVERDEVPRGAEPEARWKRELDDAPRAIAKARHQRELTDGPQRVAVGRGG